jgi:gamma-glutamyltranspeptidase/glutathione hydrolase
VREALRERGHPLDVVEDRSWVMGHAHALTVAGAGAERVYAGGADPRGDGMALGY